MVANAPTLAALAQVLASSVALRIEHLEAFQECQAATPGNGRLLHAEARVRLSGSQHAEVLCGARCSAGHQAGMRRRAAGGAAWTRAEPLTRLLRGLAPAAPATAMPCPAGALLAEILGVLSSLT